MKKQGTSQNFDTAVNPAGCSAGGTLQTYWDKWADIPLDTAIRHLESRLPRGTLIEFEYRAANAGAKPYVFLHMHTPGDFNNIVKLNLEDRYFYDGDTDVMATERTRGIGSQLLAVTASLGRLMGFESIEFCAAKSLGAPTWAKFWPIIDEGSEYELGEQTLQRLRALEKALGPKITTRVGTDTLDAIRTIATNIREGTHAVSDLASIAACKQDLTAYADKLLPIIACGRTSKEVADIMSPCLTLGRYLLCFQEYNASINLKSDAALHRIEAVLNTQQQGLKLSLS